MVKKSRKQHLRNTRVYLSGPMGFVALRGEEMQFGWRTRVSQFLKRMGVRVYDPWNKPKVRWFYEYGRETTLIREFEKLWTYEVGVSGERARAQCSDKFKDTMHIDLRMVDTSDFLIAFCPTNIYSVGTVHEIVVASQQHKPVLVVSPRVSFPSLAQLRTHIHSDKKGKRILASLEEEVPIKPNTRGQPHPWYMALLGGHSFFDGFGFARYAQRFSWKQGPLDRQEAQIPPQRPLLPFLERLNSGVKPRRFDTKRNKRVRDQDWLVFTHD